MTKKSFAFSSIVILILLLLPLISAASFDFNEAKYQMGRVIESALGILSPFFEQVIGDYSTSAFFFEKILLLILLIIIARNILDKTPLGEDNKKISLVISVIVSILAIRFINENKFFEAILVQYGVIGIAITTILPMVIFFYFINNTKVGTYGRKVFWALYSITLLFLWLSKSSEIPEVANWIYGLALTAALIFIFFDKSIHSYFGITEFNKFLRENNQELIKHERRKIVGANEDLTKGVITAREHDKIVNESRKRIVKYSKT